MMRRHDPERCRGCRQRAHDVAVPTLRPFVFCAQFPEYRRHGELPIPRPGQLVPSSEKAAHRVIQMSLHIVPRLQERLKRRALARIEIRAPHTAPSVGA